MTMLVLCISPIVSASDDVDASKFSAQCHTSGSMPRNKIRDDTLYSCSAHARLLKGSYKLITIELFGTIETKCTSVVPPLAPGLGISSIFISKELEFISPDWVLSSYPLAQIVRMALR